MTVDAVLTQVWSSIAASWQIAPKMSSGVLWFGVRRFTVAASITEKEPDACIVCSRLTSAPMSFETRKVVAEVSAEVTSERRWAGSTGTVLAATERSFVMKGTMHPFASWS